MIKWTRFTVAALILASVACTKEKKTEKDVFPQVSPKILSNGSSIDYATDWNLGADRKLELSDTIDFSNSPAVSGTVDSLCHFESADYPQTFELSPPFKINLTSVIPSILLSKDILNSELECSFAFNLRNAAGSTYAFKIGTTPIKNALANKVTIENGRTTEISSLSLIGSPEEYKNILFRYLNSGSATAQLACQDVTMEELPFNHFIDLQYFDQLRQTLRAGSDEEVLVKKDFMQLCRLIIRETQKITAVSPLFTMRVRGQALSIVKDPSLFNGRFVEDTANVFTSWQTRFTYASFTISNDWKSDRVVVIPRLNIHTQTLTYVRNAYVREGGWMSAEVSTNFGSFDPSSPSEWQIRMPPGSKVYIKIMFDTPETPFCLGQQEVALGYGVYSRTANFTVQELSISNSKVKDWTLDISEPIVVSTSAHQEWTPEMLKGMPHENCPYD